MRSAYLLFNMAIASSLFGPFFVHVRFWSRWRGMLRGIVYVSLPFIVWDIYASSAGHWFFNERFTFALRPGGIPVEEMLFFISVPLACMYVWSVIERFADKQIVPTHRARTGLLVAALVLLASTVFVQGRGYTHIVLVAAAFTCVVLTRHTWLIVSRRFWVFQVVCLGLFIACNTILTSLPIITYGDQAILGIRVGTIPIEDFAYNFALLNLFLLAFISGDMTKLRYHRGKHATSKP